MHFILAIKVSKCLHQWVDGFFNSCVDMVWKTKGIGNLLLLRFYVHFTNKRCWWRCNEHKASIFKHVVIINERFFCSMFFQMFLLCHYMICLLWFKGLGCLICSCSPCDPHFKKDSLFFKTWVLSSCTFFLPFVGCFVLLMIDMFSSLICMYNYGQHT